MIPLPISLSRKDGSAAPTIGVSHESWARFNRGHSCHHSSGSTTKKEDSSNSRSPLI